MTHRDATKVMTAADTAGTVDTRKAMAVERRSRLEALAGGGVRVVKNASMPLILRETTNKIWGWPTCTRYNAVILGASPGARRRLRPAL
jgi:hypothetical protein